MKLKLIVGFVLMVMITSTGASAAPVPVEGILNPTPPEYYEVLGPYQLTDHLYDQLYPKILIDSEDNLHMVYMDTRNDPDRDDTDYWYEIFYKKFDKDGNLLVGATQLTDESTIPFDIKVNSGGPRHFIPGPSIAFDSDGNIHMSYQDYSKHTFAGGTWINCEIYYMKLAGDLDCGGGPAAHEDLVLIDEQRVSQGIAHSGDSDLVLDSNDNVYIVWYDHRSAYYNWEIYLEKLSKDGDILIDDQRLTSYMGYCAGPEIAVDSEDNLHIVHKSYDWDTDLNHIYYIKLEPDGTVLVDKKLVTTDYVTRPSPWGKNYPYLVVDSEDNVHVTWHDERNDGNYEIYYLKLDSDGDPLMTEPLRITETSWSSHIQDMVIDDSDRIFITWREDITLIETQLYLAIIDPDGSYHLEPYAVTVSELLTKQPAFAWDSNGYIHIAFVDKINLNADIYHIILKPYTLELAFVPTGVPGGTVDIEIYEDDVLIDELTVERFSGNPRNSAVMYTLEVALEKSYRLEFTYTATKNGANPMKVYLVEGGELTQQLLRTVVNKNSGKSPKQTASLGLDELIADHF